MKSRKNILKDAGVLLIAVILVSTAIFVVSPTTKATQAPLPLLFSKDKVPSIPPAQPSGFLWDFSTWLPAGWTEDGSHAWQQCTTYSPSGTPPCAYLPGSSIVGGSAWLMSPAVDTTGFSTLILSFESYIDWFSDSDTYCFVEVTADAGVSWYDIAPWTNPIVSDYGPADYTVDISAYTGPTTQIRFRFSGNSFDINDWYLDDVQLTAGDKPDLVIWTSTGSIIGDGIYEHPPPPAITQIGGSIFHWFILYLCVVFIQNDGTAPMSCTIQPTKLPGGLVFSGTIFYPPSSSSSTTVLTHTPVTLPTINPGPGLPILLVIIKVGTVRVQLDALSTSGERDSVIVQI